MPFIRPFNVASNDQSKQLEHDIKAIMYKGVHEAAEKKKVYIRFIGLGVGIASGLLTIAMRIASFCENLFKGFINIAGAPFNKGLSPSRGLSMLFFHAPKNIILLPFSIFSASLKLFEKTAKIACDGSNYSYGKWCEHDPIEKAENDRRIEKNKKDSQAVSINDANKILKNYPTNLNSLLTLASAYEKGEGHLNVDLEQAHQYRIRAAAQGDLNSMLTVGCNFEQGKGTAKNPKEAIKFLDEAFNLLPKEEFKAFNKETQSLIIEASKTYGRLKANNPST